MSLLSSPTTFAAAETGGRHLPMDPLFFGIISIALFGLALAFLWSFRNTAAKTDPRNIGDHGAQGGHAAQHGDARTPH
jgi:hypothetical protein